MEESTLADLLKPSLQDHQPYSEVHKPWALGGFIYVAFFGGMLPLIVLAYRNAKRLQIAPKTCRLMVVIGSVVLIALAVFAFYLPRLPALNVAGSGVRTIRYAGRLLAVVSYFGIAALLRSASRVYESQYDYAPLLKPGLIAVLGLGTLQGLVLALLYMWGGGTS